MNKLHYLLSITELNQYYNYQTNNRLNVLILRFITFLISIVFFIHYFLYFSGTK